MTRGLLVRVSEQREQRKRSEIKTNAVCGNTKTRPKGAALILFGGAPRPGNRSIRLISSPGRPPRACTCESNVRLATHPRARVCLFAHARTRAYASPKYICKGRGEAAGPSRGPPRQWGALSAPQPVCSAGPSPNQSLAGAGSLITRAPRPGSAVQPVPSHPLELSLETLSGSPRPPPRARLDASPAAGAGRQLGNQSGLPGDPGGPSRRLRAAGPAPLARATESPQRAPTEATRTPRLPARVAAVLPRLTGRIGSGQTASRPRPCRPSSQRARGPVHPSSSSGARPCGARPDPVTRWTAQPGPLPALPPSPRARPGRTRQEPGRDAPALLGVLSACHLRAVEGRCGGEGEERRRGRRRRGAGSQPDGKAQSAASRVLAPNSVGRKEVRRPLLNPIKAKFGKSCPVHVDA